MAERRLRPDFLRPYRWCVDSYDGRGVWVSTRSDLGKDEARRFLRRVRRLDRLKEETKKRRSLSKDSPKNRTEVKE